MDKRYERPATSLYADENFYRRRKQKYISNPVQGAQPSKKYIFHTKSIKMSE